MWPNRIRPKHAGSSLEEALRPPQESLWPYASPSSPSVPFYLDFPFQINSTSRLTSKLVSANGDREWFIKESKPKKKKIKIHSNLKGRKSPQKQNLRFCMPITNIKHSFSLKAQPFPIIRIFYQQLTSFPEDSLSGFSGQ